MHDPHTPDADRPQVNFDCDRVVNGSVVPAQDEITIEITAIGDIVLRQRESVILVRAEFAEQVAEIIRNVCEALPPLPDRKIEPVEIAAPSTAPADRPRDRSNAERQRRYRERRRNGDRNGGRNAATVTRGRAEAAE